MILDRCFKFVEGPTSIYFVKSSFSDHNQNDQKDIENISWYCYSAEENWQLFA